MKGISDKTHGANEKPQKWQENIQMKGTTNPLYTAVHERRASVRPQPKNTTLYEVTESDTITNVAARFHTTPSELVNLNRLISRVLFPGQIIYVPDPGEPSSVLGTLKEVDSNGQESKLLNDIQLLLGKDSKSNESTKSPSIVAEHLNTESIQKFLKINVKHITDGEGVVSGVLLVTPNHVMFDPNVSDPLVVEHGSEKYGVVAPLYMVVRIAIYPDIVRMKIKDAWNTSKSEKSFQLYHSTAKPMKKSYSQDNNFISEEKNREKLEESPENKLQIDDAHPPLLSKISEKSEASPTLKPKENNENAKILKIEEPAESESFTFVNEVDVDPFGDKALPSPTFKSSDQELEDMLKSNNEDLSKKKSGFEKTKEKLQKGLRRFSVSESIFPAHMHRRMSLPIISPSSESTKDKASPSKKSKPKETKSKQESPSTSYMNMVDAKPDLFISLDKLIPRPATSFVDNPLYLCLRMGKPLKQSVHNRFNPVMDFGDKVKSEYWFSIPQERVDNLYFFVLRWVPEKYGDIDDVNFEKLGFEPIDDNDDIDSIHDDTPLSIVPGRRATWAFPWKLKKTQDGIRSKEWEFVHRDDCLKDTPFFEPEIVLPELSNDSVILTEHHIRKLCDVLPARAVGYAWGLIYSTGVNGFGLKTLYREMQNYDSPVLIIIANTNGAVFGAMLSCPLKLSDHFYGTGESFLFTFYPEFKYFPWSGENNYFIKGNTGSFAIGASDGQFGLWLDDDLYHGCTKECRTYNNDCLSDTEDFIVKSLEAWGFV